MNVLSGTRRGLKVILAAALLAVGALPAAAADFPNGPVRLIVPYAAGGGTDLTARTYAERLALVLKQPVLIENRTGGGTVAGTQMVANSKPDGYRLLFLTLAHSITPALNKNLPYDTINDFEFISTVGLARFMIAAPLSSPASNLAELIASIKKDPSAKYASPGIGSPVHLGSVLFLKTIDAKAVHVPYKGSSEALIALMQGTSTFYLCEITACAELKDKVKLLAVVGPKRLEAMPEIPTVAEAGLPNFDVYSWYALAAPKGTPKDIVDFLNKASNEALASPELVKLLKERNLDIFPPSTPASAKKLVVDEMERWAPIVLESGASQ